MVESPAFEAISQLDNQADDLSVADIEFALNGDLLDEKTEVNQLVEELSLTENSENKEMMIDALFESVNAISSLKVEEYAKNWSAKYSEEEIKVIQLWARVAYWDDSISIDWKRWHSIYQSTNSPAEKRTNTYIYLSEIIARDWIIDTRRGLDKDLSFENILSVPNLQDMLSVLPDDQTQAEVFWEFLDFYLSEIKIKWMYFENTIGSLWKDKNIMSQILTYMIIKKQYSWEAAQDIIELGERDKENIQRSYQWNPSWEDITIDQFLWDTITTLQSIAIGTMTNTVKLNKDKSIDKNLAEISRKGEKWAIAANMTLGINDDEVNDLKNKYPGISSQKVFVILRSEKLSSNELNDKSKREIALYFTALLSYDVNTWVFVHEYRQDISFDIRKIFKDNEIDIYFSTEDAKKIRFNYDEAVIAKQVKALQFGTVNDVVDQIEKNPNGIKFYDIQNEMETYKNLYPSLFNTYTNAQYTDNQALNTIKTSNWVKDLKRIDFNGNGKLSYINVIQREKLWYDKNDPQFKNKKNFRFYSKTDIASSRNPNNGVYEASRRDFYLVCEDDNGSIYSYENNTGDERVNTKENYWAGWEGYIKNQMAEHQSLTERAEFTEIKNDFTKWQEPIWEISSVFSTFQNKELQREDIATIRETVVLFKRDGGLNFMEAQVPKMEEHLAFLKSMAKLQSGTYKTEAELAVDQIIKNIEWLVDLFWPGKNWWPSNMSYICDNIMSDQFFSNDNQLKRGRHRFAKEKWWIMALSFVVAVWAAVASGWLASWFLWIVFMAAISTWAGLVATEWWGILDDYLLNAKTTIIVDWIEYEVTKTLKSRYMKYEDWELSWEDYLLELWKEFAVGTISMLWFMSLWKVLWSQISKFTKVKPNSWLTSLAKAIKPKVFNPQLMTNPATKWITQNISKSFLKSFWKELTSEVWEEAMETWAGRIHPVLWGMMTTYNSLSGVNINFFSNNKVTWWETDVDLDAWTFTTNFDYNWNATEITNEFTSQGYVLVENTDGNILLQKTYWSWSDAYTHNYSFKTTKKPYALRNAKSILIWDKTESDIFNIDENHDWFVLKEWATAKEIDTFKKSFLKKWVGVIRDNPDGWFDIIMDGETISVIANPNTIETQQNNDQSSGIWKFTWSYQSHITNKFNFKNIDIPLKNGKHEYEIFDLNGNKLDRNNISEIEAKELTVKINQQSAKQNNEIWWNFWFINKSWFAFSQDNKMPWDHDLVFTTQEAWLDVEGQNAFIQTLKDSVIPAFQSGKIVWLKFTHNIEQNKTIHDFTNPNGDVDRILIENMVKNNTLRVNYQNVVDVEVWWKNYKWSMDTETFIEDGSKQFEIDANETIEVDIGNKIMQRFPTAKWYLPYAQDLLVTDLDKDLSNKQKKLKGEKRFADVMNAIDVMDQQVGTSRTIKYKMIDMISGEYSTINSNFTRTRTERLAEVMQSSKAYNDESHPLYSQYHDAVSYIVVTTQAQKEHKWRNIYTWTLIEFRQITTKLKVDIKKFKEKNGEPPYTWTILNESNALTARVDILNNYNFSADENFPFFSAVYLLTHANSYDIKTRNTSEGISNTEIINLQSQYPNMPIKVYVEQINNNPNYKNKVALSTILENSNKPRWSIDQEGSWDNWVVTILKWDAWNNLSPEAQIDLLNDLNTIHESSWLDFSQNGNTEKVQKLRNTLTEHLYPWKSRTSLTIDQKTTVADIRRQSMENWYFWKDSNEKLVINSVFEQNPKLAMTVYESLETIEYTDVIPIEEGKYYRVTGMSEIYTILTNNKLKQLEKKKVYFDRGTLTLIARNSNYTIEELEDLNYTNTNKIRDLHKEFVIAKNTKKGKVVLWARAKSNHGDIAFQKEGFFSRYDPTIKDSIFFGAPVIVGDEKKSEFQEGHHSKYFQIFNKDIKKNTAVVLRKNFNIDNFDIYLYKEGKGWYLLPKNNQLILQQARQLYFQYLNTIFPDIKVIVTKTSTGEYIIKNKTQTYELGSKQDIDGFKNFINNL